MGAIDTETRASLESLIAWWREAGVDAPIDEAPRNWLAAGVGLLAERVAAPLDEPTSSPNDAVRLPPGRLPAAFSEFLIWWANDTSVLDDFPKRRRVLPEGREGSGLMIVVDMPEAGDAEAGRLMSGDGGKLFDKMLAALKLTRGQVYLATLAPARTVTAGIEESLRDRLTPILKHHIALARPVRLWLMGDAVSRAVLGIDVRQAMGRLHSVNHDGMTIDVIATVNLQMLLSRPEQKSVVWRDMQMLIEGSRP